jgi:hypothetical protein
MIRAALITTGLLLGVFASMAQSRAGDIIVYGFEPGSPAAREVLRHVEVKGLVAEFLDPADTGLGKSLGYLLWREVLTAISDQRGAGVILARLPGERRLTDLLKQDYHQAALEIARGQNARMLLWGAVSSSGETVHLSSYLTLIPEIIGADLALRLTISRTDLQAANPRTRFNFAPVTLGRDELFHRAIVTRADTRLKGSPNRDDTGDRLIPGGTALTAVDMQGPWFEVRLADGGRGYVDQQQVDVPPRRITADQTVRVRAGPGTDHRVVYRIGEGQSFTVLDMRYREGQGTWYRIERDGDPGWVASWVVRPHYSLPAVMFMAGLYRYQSQNYDEAVRSFERYLRSAGEEESNVNRAAAYQLLGAAQLAGRRFDGPRDFDRDLLAPFDAAVSLTPYDPAAHNLRALGRMAAWSLPTAIEDLQHSLELDRFNPSSHRLLESLSQMLDPDSRSAGMLRIYDFYDQPDLTRVQTLRSEYARSRELIAPDP